MPHGTLHSAQESQRATRRALATWGIESTPARVAAFTGAIALERRCSTRPLVVAWPLALLAWHRRGLPAGTERRLLVGRGRARQVHEVRHVQHAGHRAHPGDDPLDLLRGVELATQL